MAFRDFTYPDVLDRLGLTAADVPLFPDPPAAAIRPDFADTLAVGMRMAGSSASEKARSEFLIAPVLVEVQRRHLDRVRIFSGVELSADPDKGLNGVCDFVFVKVPAAYAVRAPIAAVAEAKPDVMITGFGQCIAGMRAAAVVNDKAGRPVPAVYGVVTSGVQWKLLRLTGDAVAIDTADYLINQPDRVLGALCHLVEVATA